MKKRTRLLPGFEIPPQIKWGQVFADLLGIFISPAPSCCALWVMTREGSAGQPCFCPRVK